ncbi:hypothetical protein MTO96_031988 [Rhipicephalus appendiculatus]
MRRGDSVEKTLQFGNTERTNIVPVMRMPQCESTRLRRGDSVDKTLQFGNTKRTNIVPVMRMPQCERTLAVSVRLGCHECDDLLYVVSGPCPSLMGRGWMKGL